MAGPTGGLRASWTSTGRRWANICGCQGRQELWRPDPAIEMAGFESELTSEPGVRMAGFAAGSDSEPGVEMAGFEAANCRYLPTVSRWMSSSRAIRRQDQPCAAKVVIECCKLTLS